MQIFPAVAALLVCVVGAASLPALALAPIADGTYNCKAGSKTLMVSIGTIQVSGSAYKFKGIIGPTTSGTYWMDGRSYRWRGTMGTISSAQILESGPDATSRSFWFKYKDRPEELPTMASCQRAGA